MLFIRSFIFNLAFYLFTVSYLILVFPVFFLPRKYTWFIFKFWAHACLWLLRTIARIDINVRGKENLIKGPLILAAKHQSVWETFTLLTITKDPTYILKKQLMFIPLFGWYAWKFKLISVHRGKGKSTLKPMIEQAKHAAQEGREIIIFPEGTRRAPEAPPAYKYGVTALYKALNVPVLPVVHNAGLFWPRRSFLRYPGTVTMEILSPIPPYLQEEEFQKQLVGCMEAKSAELIKSAISDHSQ